MYRITEKRREEIAAPAIVARISTLRSALTLSDVCFDIFVIQSIAAILSSPELKQLDILLVPFCYSLFTLFDFCVLVRSDVDPFRLLFT